MMKLVKWIVFSLIVVALFISNVNGLAAPPKANYTATNGAFSMYLPQGWQQINNFVPGQMLLVSASNGYGTVSYGTNATPLFKDVASALKFVRGTYQSGNGITYSNFIINKAERTKDGRFILANVSYTAKFAAGGLMNMHEQWAMETTGNAAQFMRIGAVNDSFQSLLPQLQQIADSIAVLKPPTPYSNQRTTAVQQPLPAIKSSPSTPVAVKFAPMKQVVSSDGMYSATLPSDWQLLSSGINGRSISAPDDTAGAIDANIRIPGLLSRDPQQMIRNFLKYISNGQNSGTLVLNSLSAPVIDQKLQGSMPAMYGMSAKCYDLSGTFTMNSKPYKAEFVVVINSSQFGLSSGTISYLWVPDDNRAPAYYSMLRKVYDTAQINSAQVLQQSQNENAGWANVRNAIQGSHEAFGSYMGSVRNASDARTKSTYAQGDAILGNSYWQDSQGQTYSTDSYGTKNNTNGTYVEAQSLNYNNFTGHLGNEQLIEISSYDLAR